jgi:protein-S-isoprenylcysteine O-methyltransferase Ste14
MPDVPLLGVVATVWAYTTCVVGMAVRARGKNRRPALIVPTERLERRLWSLWVPLVIAQNVLPALAIRRRHPLLAVPEIFQTDPVFASLRWAASLCALLCLVVTITCWARMGESWRVGVTPDERTRLITDGMYARIRHPIYAFNGLLFFCVVVVVPTLLMITVTALHAALLSFKARHEERFLLGVHGEAYAEYCRRTGRFFPRLASRAKPPATPEKHMGPS